MLYFGYKQSRFYTISYYYHCLPIFSHGLVNIVRRLAELLHIHLMGFLV